MKTESRRILIIDDNRAIHEDFGKIFGGGSSDGGLSAMEDALFGEATPEPAEEQFELCSAFQGRDGFEMVRRAEGEGQPFAVAFVDMRMPPGWDGVETVSRIWEVSRGLQTVICTAYSDYTTEEIIGHLGKTDRLTILRKPVDPGEVKQLAAILAGKSAALQHSGGTARMG